MDGIPVCCNRENGHLKVWYLPRLEKGVRLSGQVSGFTDHSPLTGQLALQPDIDRSLGSTPGKAMTRYLKAWSTCLIQESRSASRLSQSRLIFLAYMKPEMRHDATCRQLGSSRGYFRYRFQRHGFFGRVRTAAFGFLSGNESQAIHCGILGRLRLRIRRPSPNRPCCCRMD
jgi:hypothetical protein